MKKLILTVAISAIMTTIAFADKIVAPETLPQEAKAFIEANFNGATATYVEKEFNQYDVQLSDGTDIDFNGKGEWKSIEARTNPLPASVIPAPVAATVSKTHPQAAIMKIEKENGGYEVKLNNMMELIIGNDGTLKGQKIDD